MAALTLKAVNLALIKSGASEELVKGKDYFYFSGGDTPEWDGTIVYVPRLNDLTLDEWVDEWRSRHGSSHDQA